ncbi:HAMP domain-containing protein [Nitrogeniibacter mangrovi]|uniref:HAMP domain-containing protein n=1 Tax=Nitrogeniibacter mangrovi TaxID=2016596 RepID=A0A6C1B3Z5_9RHOO|nr:methyl-accepting chemotaxis protein [Nitrogeniibacter mangrovi]QID17565.1 HAMP domain-containing protein [Nitrogeniibacter mangrovi]
MKTSSSPSEAGTDARIGRLLEVVRHVAEGQLTGRITHIGEKDEIGELCWHVNNMLDQLESCFREQQTVMANASAGHYDRKVQTAGLHGEFRRALERNQGSIDMLAANARAKAEAERVERQAQEEIAALIGAAARGDFTQRIDVGGKDGFFLTLAEDVNSLMETTEQGLSDVASVLRAIAEGDLTERIDTDYEGIFGQLKEDTNLTTENLKGIIREIQEAASSINVSVSEIADGNQDLSRRTEDQAASLEETSSSMAELNTTIASNAENAAHARSMADGSRQRVSASRDAMSRLVATMKEIQTGSEQIANIVSLIESIAFQTNILALNAAVEAARAGDQGRGFAVVASEVRNLAQKSSDAAKEIKTLIASSRASVAEGSKEVGQMESVIKEAADAFEKLNHVVAEIAEASKEQALGIDQVTTAVARMDDVTQQNAALVEEAAAAADSLRDQAHGLDQATRRFRLEREVARRPVRMAFGR